VTGFVSRNIGSASGLLPTPIPGGNSGIFPVDWANHRSVFCVEIKAMRRRREREPELKIAGNVQNGQRLFHACLDAGIDRRRRMSFIPLRNLPTLRYELR
jgi:hypothetical protein